jgi:hypothetical protein
MPSRTKKLVLFCPPDKRQPLSRIKLYLAAKSVFGVKEALRGIIVANLKLIPRKKTKK